MKKLIIALFALLSSCGLTYAQTVDRTTNPVWMNGATFGQDTTHYTATDASAWLQIGRDSTSKGLLLPRVGDTSDITSPAFGLTIFSHADSCYYIYKDHWRKVGSNISDYIKATEKGIANGVATLDSNGLLKKDQVPAIAITNTFVVASVTDMLALAADTGDICIRTDSSETFILQSTPATGYDNWKKLLSPGAPVTSVNGYTGVVTLGVDDIGGAVNLTGTQTISGNKIFSNILNAKGGISLYHDIGLQSTTDSTLLLGFPNFGVELAGTYLTSYRTDTLPDKNGTFAMIEDPTLVKTSGDQTIDGTKTFSSRINLYNSTTNRIALAPVGDTSLAIIFPLQSRTHYLIFPQASTDRSFTFPDVTGTIWTSGGDNTTTGNVTSSGKGTFSTLLLNRGVTPVIEMKDADNSSIFIQDDNGRLDFNNINGTTTFTGSTPKVGIGVTAPTSMLTVNGDVAAASYKLSALNTAPASATATGTTGEIRITASYIYVCTATNTWVRAALSTF